MERADVQGLMLFAYKQHPRSRFYLLSFKSGQPREWLRRVLTDVTSGQEERGSLYRFNLAFSARGLAALGLDEQDLATFQREFVQGMAHPERSTVLGDRYSDDPKHWQWGNEPELTGPRGRTSVVTYVDVYRNGYMFMSNALSPQALLDVVVETDLIRRARARIR